MPHHFTISRIQAGIPEQRELSHFTTTMNSLSTSTLLTPSSSSPLPFNPSSSKPRTASFKSHPFSIRATSNLSSSSKYLADTLGFGYDFQPSSSYSAQPLASSYASSEYAQRAAEASDPMGMLLRERIVFLGHEIDDFVADTIIFQLLLLDAKDPTKDIRLFINSPGGSTSAALAIYDVLQLVRADVSTIGMGITASTAAIILGGGTKGKRLAMPNTRIMFHQPLGGMHGEVRTAEIQARELMQNKKTVIRIISEFTGRSLEQVELDIDRDRYLSPMEAVEFGAIDGVIDRDSIIPVQPLPEKVDELELIGHKIEFEIGHEKFINPDIPDDEIY